MPTLANRTRGALHPSQAYQELIEESEGNAASVHANILNQDLKRIGKPCLPDDINRAANATVKGPHVLQVRGPAGPLQPCFPGSRPVRPDRHDHSAGDGNQLGISACPPVLPCC